MNFFHNLKVLELASVLAGPGVGQFFAELGADVIKVENLTTGGDVTRTWKVSGEETDDRSAYFCSVNWGKQSIALDLNSHEGREIAHQLSLWADLVVVSYKPGDAEKLGVDYSTLSKINPGVIYGEVTGYGADNPRVGYDAIIQAEAGFMFMNGEPGRSSIKMPVALIDVLAGHQLKEALLVALIEKMQTGTGKRVAVSLFQCAVASLVNQGTNYLINHRIPQKQGSAHPNIAPYGDVFITQDQKELLLAIGSDRQFVDLCAILDLGELPRDPRFRTNPARVLNRQTLQEHLRNKISLLEAASLVNQLHARNVPAGIIQSLDQVFQQPEARQLLINSAAISSVKSFVAEPYVQKRSHFLPPPHFGEHTGHILTTYLSFSAEKVEELKKKNVIAVHS